MTMTTEAREEVIAEYERDLLTGDVFARAAASLHSVRGYQPPVSARSVAAALPLLADLGRRSEALSYVALDLAHALHASGSAYQAVARLYTAARDAMVAGYRDRVGAAAPDAGRPSQYVHGFRTRDALHVLVTLARVREALRVDTCSVGWCAAALCEREGVEQPQPAARRY